MSDLVMGIDVGTGSARAAVFDRQGRMLGRSAHPIRISRPEANIAEYSSENIWQAACKVAKEARKIAAARPADIAGVGFDATCSLVVRNVEGRPLSVSEDGDPALNASALDTIAWLDHRALAEAEACTASGHAVLDYLGGSMSPEMQIPKLMWLKRRHPNRWRQVGYLFDLADFLTWRATGSEKRSHCALTCKWTYLGHERCGWQGDFLEAVGLADLLERGRLPMATEPVGSNLGPLSPRSAQDLGLTVDCCVGTGLIDAHAGVLGGLAGRLAGNSRALERQATLMIGTSSSVMALSTEPRMIPGAWGPHHGAILPGCWVHDAGQSASGALLDHVIKSHAEGGEPTAAMHCRIVDRIVQLRSSEGAGFASRLHVLPDFHGNRSPLAEARTVGVISGLGMDCSFDSLCRLYWRTAVGLALGIRHILERLNANGYTIDTLHTAGGHTRSPALVQLYADATGCAIIEPEDDDAVLRGASAVAATAAGFHHDLSDAAETFAQEGRERRPDGRHSKDLDGDYRVYLEMQRHRRILDSLATEPIVSDRDRQADRRRRILI